jgi:uncharacterized Ntn-hydrolase superfamily protein
MLREGIDAAEVVAALVASDPGADRRQVAVVDARGHAAAWTGQHCIPHAAHHIGDGYSVQANMMARDTVVPAMAEAYEAAVGELAQRMMAALYAAQAEGGDIRGMQSAALRIVSGDAQATGFGRTLYDLRVDEAEEPLRELDRLVRLRRAWRINAEGYPLLEARRERALELWGAARALAPELEEMAFWQAVQLADELAEVEAGAAILREMLGRVDRREEWVELIRRLERCRLIKREGAAEALIGALEG